MAQPQMQQQQPTAAEITKKFAQAAIQEGGNLMTVVRDQKIETTPSTSFAIPALVG